MFQKTCVDLYNNNQLKNEISNDEATTLSEYLSADTEDSQKNIILMSNMWQNLVKTIFDKGLHMCGDPNIDNLVKTVNHLN